MNDSISRQQAIDEIKKEILERDGRFYKGLLVANHIIVHLPPAHSTYTDEEIQKMQDLESAEIEKAYQLGYEDGKKDAQPERKKGKWIKLDMHAHLVDHKCTACGQECYVPTCMGEPMYTYCPNCGADMRGENNG